MSDWFEWTILVFAIGIVVVGVAAQMFTPPPRQYDTTCIDGITYFKAKRGIGGAKVNADGKPIPC